MILSLVALVLILGTGLYLWSSAKPSEGSKELPYSHRRWFN